ncbi:hypothetical protein BD560DRAFT_395449 [Blakeslea trispora]|nr:hypothetical protein BD560DRAFT_395449 [Blakeslea trispora]
MFLLRSIISPQQKKEIGFALLLATFLLLLLDLTCSETGGDELMLKVDNKFIGSYKLLLEIKTSLCYYEKQLASKITLPSNYKLSGSDDWKHMPRCLSKMYDTDKHQAWCN